MTYSDVLDEMLPEGYKYFMSDSSNEPGGKRIHLTVTDGTTKIVVSTLESNGFESLYRIMVNRLIYLGTQLLEVAAKLQNS